jgi:hypothetical protein
LYQWNPVDINTNPEAGDQVFKAAEIKFGESHVRRDRYHKVGAPDFPVKAKDGRIVSCLDLSQTLRNMLVTRVDLVFIDPQDIDQAGVWLNENRQKIITSPRENENE